MMFHTPASGALPAEEPPAPPEPKSFEFKQFVGALAFLLSMMLIEVVVGMVALLYMIGR